MGQCVQEFLVSLDGSSYTAPSAGLQSYVTAAELANAAKPYLLRFFAVAAPGRAPEVYEFADWLTAKLHRAEIMPGLRIVRRGGREAVSMVAACVAAGILSLSWSFVHAEGLYWSEDPTLPGTPEWKKLSADEQAANSACYCFARIVFGAATRLQISYRLTSVMSMLMNVLGTSNSLGDAPWKRTTSVDVEQCC